MIKLLRNIRQILFVYDFQESPTGELADYSFQSGEQESSGEKTTEHQLQPDPELEAELETQSCETFCVSEEMVGNNPEEGRLVMDIKCYTVWSLLTFSRLFTITVFASLCIQVGIVNGKMTSHLSPAHPLLTPSLSPSPRPHPPLTVLRLLNLQL